MSKAGKSKERLDVLLVQRGVYETREKAKRAIMAGLVFSESERLDKPGMKVETALPLSVKGQVLPYVGRGGLKLEKAIRQFGLILTDKIILDIGASTGGFTDCALQHGAKLVYAVDVGYGQLAWKLRIDERVIVMERTNFRHMQPEDLTNGKPQVATVDVSFISLNIILPVLYPLLVQDSDVVVLIKPQFEAGREQVGKKGIVRDKDVHQSVIESVIEKAVEIGFQVGGLDVSPITGGDGNIEFLLLLHKMHEQNPRMSKTVVEVVRQAHEHFYVKGRNS